MQSVAKFQNNFQNIVYNFKTNIMTKLRFGMIKQFF